MEQTLRIVAGLIVILLLAGAGMAQQSVTPMQDKPVWTAGPFDDAALVCYTPKSGKNECALVFPKLAPAIENPTPHCPEKERFDSVLLTSERGKHWCLRLPLHLPDEPPKEKP